MMSEVEGTEVNTDYIRIYTPQDFDSQNECSTCQSNQTCVTLKSNKTYCVKDNYDPMDCGSIRDMFPALSSGKYIVSLRGLGHVTVFCDMETDGGGWTVFQRRMDGSVDFYRNWTDYRNGFGNLSSEFWLGNENLHYLLKQGTYGLRMDMVDFAGTTGFAKYSSVKVSNESSNYTVEVSGYSGNIGDCFTVANEGKIQNMQFTTYDVDNDGSAANCAVVFKGGWWYNDCYCANPNGLHLPENTTTPLLGIRYGYWSTTNKLLKSIDLMVKRV
ncbi:ficolin-2-like [Ostrea edulis]|uniref:ficolin-2-like n=1 Tax=Ostrea edulis TaxID=37623 RepID=UPI0024AF1386|nr:ficolin-2-like [Ostrea edulis]